MYPNHMPNKVAIILNNVKNILNGNGEHIKIPTRKIAKRIVMNPPIFQQLFSSSINKDRIKPAGKVV